MTTGSLTIAFAAEKEKKYYWVWHDGFAVSDFFQKAIEKKALKDFKMETLKNFLDDGMKGEAFEKGDFEFANADDGGGEWNWGLTVVSEKKAVLHGAGSCDKMVVEFLEI